MEHSGLTVLYFADAARRTGRREERLDGPAPETLGEVQAELYSRYPGLDAMRQLLLWSVDEEMARPETPLRDGAVIGVLPPFSGG